MEKQINNRRQRIILKKANVFIDKGEVDNALECLLKVLKKGRRHRFSSVELFEPILYKYLELCVYLKNARLAKEGLNYYKRVFQNIGGISFVKAGVQFYLQLVEGRTELARKECYKAGVLIDEMIKPTIPEEILISAISGENIQDQKEMTRLSLWKKFLLESYRICLQLLKTSSRLERLYHNIALKALKFCEDNHKSKLQILCKDLQIHLECISLIKKPKGQVIVSLDDPKTMKMNLQTQIEAVNVALKLKQWQVAFKLIETIQNLLAKSNRELTPFVIILYYENLADVFWRTGNHLLHAAALLQLIQFLTNQKEKLTKLSRRASKALVATLSIPLSSEQDLFCPFIKYENSAQEKIARLSALLRVRQPPKQPPTRRSLIKDLIGLNVLNMVPSELQSVYQLMEAEFDPLYLCSRMQCHLQWIKKGKDLGLLLYIPALEEMTFTRLVQQVSQVYQTITYKRLLELSVFIAPLHMERLLAHLIHNCDMQFRLDHRTKCIHFGDASREYKEQDIPKGLIYQALPAETIKDHLVHMSSALQKCVELAYPEYKKKEMVPLRANCIQMYRKTCQEDPKRILNRQSQIEERIGIIRSKLLQREERRIDESQKEQLHLQNEDQEDLVEKADQMDKLEEQANNGEKEQEESIKNITKEREPLYAETTPKETEPLLAEAPKVLQPCINHHTGTVERQPCINHHTGTIERQPGLEENKQIKYIHTGNKTLSKKQEEHFRRLIEIHEVKAKKKEKKEERRLERAEKKKEKEKIDLLKKEAKDKEKERLEEVKIKEKLKKLDHLYRTNCFDFGGDVRDCQRETLEEEEPTLQFIPSQTFRCNPMNRSSPPQRGLATVSPELTREEIESMIEASAQKRKEKYQKADEKKLRSLLKRKEKREKIKNLQLEREELEKKVQEDWRKRMMEEHEEKLKKKAIKRENDRLMRKQIKTERQKQEEESKEEKQEQHHNLDRPIECPVERERTTFQMLEDQEKEVDYYERTKRLLEIPRLKNFFEDQNEKAKQLWQTQEEVRVKKMRERHGHALDTARRLQRMLPDRDSFIEMLKILRQSKVQKKLDDAALRQPSVRLESLESFNVLLVNEWKNKMMDWKQHGPKECWETYLLNEEGKLIRDCWESYLLNEEEGLTKENEEEKK